MASTETLDRVVEQTSSLDISESNGPLNPAQKESKETVNNTTAEAINSEETSAKPAGATVKSLPKAFRDNFRLFSKFGDTKSDGKMLTLSQSDKWMRQAKVIDGKKLTTTDTGIYFKKCKSLKIGLGDYHKFIQSLAQNKGLAEEELIQKMAECGAPGTNTNTSSPGQIQDTITRLTDPSKYTGSHKLRFDEAGKGKGLAGRKDVTDGAAAGYVHGYHNRNSYDKTH